MPNDLQVPSPADHEDAFDPARETLVPRDRVAHVIGPDSAFPEILEGIQSARLCALPESGWLYLTRSGMLAAVHATENAEVVLIRRFGGCPASAWQRLQRLYPEVLPGETFPRFWLTGEYIPYGGTILYGLLDLQSMDVLERGTSRVRMLERVEQANAAPVAYLHAVEFSRSTPDLRI